MNAKRESSVRWDYAFVPRIMSIIKKAKAEARYLKAVYLSHQNFELRNMDGMRQSVDLMKQECDLLIGMRQSIENDS